MKLKEFTHSDITVKYAYLGSRKGSRKALLVGICNPLEKDGTVEFLPSLSRFDVPRLFIAAAKEYQFGLHLVKGDTWAPRDAILNLIEKYRTENGIERSDTYLVAFCLATQPAMVMAIENGYNLVITEFVYGSTNTGLWGKGDPERLAFQDDIKKVRGPYMEFTSKEFHEQRRKFTGRDDLLSCVREYFDEVSKAEPQKFTVPRIHYFAGKHEEGWKLAGKNTIEKLEGHGMNVEVTVSDEQFRHTQALPHFIKYLTRKLTEIGL